MTYFNRLVFAAEALASAPDRPASLAGGNCPTNDPPETIETALVVLEGWRAYASKLNDRLSRARKTRLATYAPRPSKRGFP